MTMKFASDEMIEYMDNDERYHMASASRKLLASLWGNHPSILRSLRAKECLPPKPNRPHCPYAKSNNLGKHLLPKKRVQHKLGPAMPIPLFNGRLPPSEVLYEIARIFRYSMEDIKGKKRNRSLIYARAVFAKVMRERGVSYPIIGRLLGGRDHTTIINLYRRWDDFRAMDERVEHCYDILRGRGDVL